MSQNYQNSSFTQIGRHSTSAALKTLCLNILFPLHAGFFEWISWGRMSLSTYSPCSLEFPGYLSYNHQLYWTNLVSECGIAFYYVIFWYQDFFKKCCFVKICIFGGKSVVLRDYTVIKNELLAMFSLNSLKWF